MTETTENEIESGIESENTDIRVDADVYGYVDDGEHATVWAFTRTSDDVIEKITFRCEAGLIDRDGVDEHYVSPDESTDEWARNYAEGHKSSVQVARDYWN